MGPLLTRRNQLDAQDKGVKPPGEVHQIVQGLKEVSHFKAIEFKTWLLNVAPLLTVDPLERDLYDLLQNYQNYHTPSFYSLLEADEYLPDCERLIKDFFGI